LVCSDGQAGQLLVAHEELVDTALVEMMEPYCEMLRGQGNGQAADWLQGLAEKLKEVLGLGEGSLSSSSPRDTSVFMVKILQLIGQMQGDRTQLHEFFCANVGRLDGELLRVLPDIFALLIQENDPSMIASMFSEFGNLIQGFSLGSSILNLEISITAYKQVLQVRNRNDFPEKWATTQNNLGIAYNKRIQGTRTDNIERAIESYEQALQVRTLVAYPGAWAQTQNNLGNAYVDRIKGERADNIERAIYAYRLALQVYTRNEFRSEWAMTHNNLAIAYSDRIEGKRADNLEQAITLYQLVLEVRTLIEFPEAWAGTQNNLGTAYTDHIRGERADNIERAIACYEKALQVRTLIEFPEAWAGTQNNLGNAYKKHIRGKQADNLEQAIACYEKALKVYTREAFPAQWAMMQNNLGNVYGIRIIGKASDNSKKAILHYEEALQVRTRDAFPEDWAGTQNNLGNIYKKQIREANFLEKAITCYEKALQIYTRKAFPEDWAMIKNNLGDLYANLTLEAPADNRKQAIAFYREALQVRTLDSFPQDCRQTAQNLGNLHIQEKSWALAVGAYQIATAATEILYQSSISYASKGDELKSTAKIYHRLAYAQAQLGNNQAAVLTLEQGRARGLSESLSRDRANIIQLQQLAPYLYTEYQDITQQLRNLESLDRDRMVSTDRDRIPENLITTTTRLRKELESTIAQIRQVPTYKNFLTPTKWEDVQSALTFDYPLIYLVTTTHGSLALIATPDNTDPIWPKLTETQLTTLLNTYFTAYRNSQTDRQTWHNTIKSTTHQLWDLLMGPIVQQLKTMGIDRATLIPTGYLSLLPLHAAWTRDTDLKRYPTGKRYVLDDIHFTYTPNARSLTAARKIADRPWKDSILAIDNPTGDEKLKNSEREINCAIDSFTDRTVLRHDNATIDAVKSGLSEAAIVHFSCHGTANFTEPLNSGLLMSDGLLTLKDFLALNLAQDSGIRLAILSACETGLPGLDNIDEVVSLLIGLLQAGVAGVISSLWSVSDLSTMLLLTKFYELWREQKLPPDQALRQAQIWLRDSTNAEKVIEFKNTIDQTRMPASTAQQLFDELAWETKNERSFNHPFHWAAFSYTGI